MEMKLLMPFDGECPELDTQEVERLKDECEFDNPSEWIVYQAKVFYEAFRNYRKAAEILEEGLENDPDNQDLMFCLAECYSRDPQKLEKALEYCEQGLEIDNNSDYGHTIRARVQLAMGESLEAYISAMNALKINHHNYEAGVYLGTIGFAIATAEGDIKEMEYSIKNLRTTLSLNPTSKKLSRIIEENEQYFEKFRQSKGEK